jgi:predicted RNA binding protein YcfA (HicA-like mRNA interferase family)
MGSKYPTLKASEVIRSLQRHGFRFKTQKGSHARYVKLSDKGELRVTIPMHSEVNKGTLQSILGQARLTLEEFMEKL